MSLIEILISDLCKGVTWCIESEVLIVEMTSGLLKIEKNPIPVMKKIVP